MDNNVITLDLTNLSDNDETLDLFSYNENGLVDIVATTTITNFFSTLDIVVTYLNNGVSSDDLFASQTSLSNFVANANIFYSGLFVFSLEAIDLKTSKMLVKILNLDYSLTKITQNPYE